MIENRDKLIEEYQLLMELTRREAKSQFYQFVKYCYPGYQFNWHHEYLISILQYVATHKRQRVIISMPPRHGKTELASRMFPAYMFGRNPDLNIIACSYTADLAQNINGDVQKIMLSQEYKEVFPETNLFERNVVTTLNPKRNKTEFDIVNRNGSYTCAGVGGPITGKGCELLIIDDPVKNHQEAESETYRKRTYKWYSADAYSRLEDNGSVIIIMTRWHEDDLAGRLIELSQLDDHDDWTVINFPAIKETHLDTRDPREIGEALWQSKYDENELRIIRGQMGSKYWASLYQGQPTKVEGNLFKRAWFTERYRDAPNGIVNFYIDPAYTKDADNDPTGIMAGIEFRGILYITHAISVRLEFPDLIMYLEKYFELHGYSSRSRIFIEPKASGLSIYQQIKKELPKYNIIKDKPPKDSKVIRANGITAKCEAGKVLFPKSIESWVDETIDEICGFPSVKHDDRVDCLVGLVQRTLNKPGGRLRGMSV